MRRRVFLGSIAATAIATPSRATSFDMSKEINKAVAEKGVLDLPAGQFVLSPVQINKPFVLRGVPGQTILSGTTDALVNIAEVADVTIEGITFASDSKTAKLVTALNVENLTIRNCQFLGGGMGISLEGTSGRIADNICRNLEITGIFSTGATGLVISGNVVSDVGNNGIQVWQAEKLEDGTQIINNRISKIAARAGGTGQNGNGINVYLASHVIVANNRVSDCAFSGIRNNSGDAVQIVGNSISRSGEVAIYVEFSFEGAVVANNMLTDVAFGISITNLDVGGRLASVTGNLIRNAKGGTADGVKVGGAIHAEADTLVANNVIENAKDFGINLGWGAYARNLSAHSNLIRNSHRPISASVTQGSGTISISNNRIEGAKGPAILGMDHDKVVSEDLSKDGVTVPPNLTISSNVVTP
jgi:uncharacterized secreted repeat protein (TIGR03808 family)